MSESEKAVQRETNYFNTFPNTENPCSLDDYDVANAAIKFLEQKGVDIKSIIDSAKDFTDYVGQISRLLVENGFIK
jgi:hypothetical protein